MKKQFTVLIIVIILLFAGCGGQSAGPEPLPADNLGPVAGAAMYRGTVTEISPGTAFTIEQYTGTDFGYPSLQFTVGENTRTDIQPADIATGMFLEIFYGAPPGGEPVQPVEAIQVKELLEANLVYMNGEVAELTPEAEREGVILLKRIDNMGEVLVRYSGETQFYLDFDDIREGYRLNVFTNGISTRSMPPQIFALEIRPYA